MFPQNMFNNQPNNFYNYGGNLNSPRNSPRNNQMNFMLNNNIINQPFPNPNPLMNMMNFNTLANNMMFAYFLNLMKNNNNNISIIFRFMANSKYFKVNAKQTERLIDIINRFKNNGCPKDLKSYLNICVCNGNLVDKNKTLIELGINNGDSILFMNKIKDYSQTVYKATKKMNMF